MNLFEPPSIILKLVRPSLDLNCYFLGPSVFYLKILKKVSFFKRCFSFGLNKKYNFMKILFHLF
jgi:hypothetical protein